MTLQVVLQAFKMGIGQIVSIFVFCIQSTKTRESQLPPGLLRLTLQTDENAEKGYCRLRSSPSNQLKRA
ncbi:unnamed protein product [Larinioides sclopetarius]|uniref:Uncharacterized protein n=1 Tax=Larinioides sclopetarius TaxID=280406 RepID=A0AAV1ZGE4_9ARAC